MPSLPLLTADDFATDVEPRWCPGCGDFSILAQLKHVLAGLRVPREKIVFVSGVGCAGRTPYYLNTYGFHTVHGRAPAIATGIKIANPELDVWVVTGDGDALGAGTNHLLHALRRNIGLKILLFNNEVYGLTKGQHSPTSRTGTRTRSSPDGSFETPLRPLSLALAAEAGFIARTLDVDVDHFNRTLQRAAAYKGTALVEIYQNCKVFNDGVFDYATDKDTKADSLLELEHGQPLIFGKDRNRGLRLSGLAPIVVALNGKDRSEDLLVHDEALEDPLYAMLLSRLVGPDFPECIGVLRAVPRPTFEEQLAEQRALARGAKHPAALLEAALAGDDPWPSA
jgi:2-oxoglutarate ferredoxin oxidoreductase subunit beta